MDREDIIRMAREAGGKDRRTGWWDIHTGDLERFAALVAAHEREACAKLCEGYEWVSGHTLPSNVEMAAAIRSRT